jgi:AAA15 family ATPase/GTPase
MSNHFIREIEIKNYKLFKDFKAEGFGRVNLIGGKNNVGKTAFMEACYLHKQITTIALSDIIISRYKSSFFDDLMERTGVEHIDYEIEEIAKEIIGNTEIKIGRKNKKKIKYDEEEFEYDIIKNIVYIDNFKQSDTKYDDWYAKIIEQGLEDKVDKYIKNFDNNINKFRIIKSEPKCSKVNDNIFYNLNEFGDGLGKFIAYTCLFLSIKDGIVFLDEIENGVHYTNLDKLWEIILTISKQQNVQVFATTHSKECIKSYARVAKKLEDKEITFIELGKNKKDEIKALVMDSKRFQREIDMDNEVRGW